MKGSHRKNRRRRRAVRAPFSLKRLFAACFSVHVLLFAAFTLAASVDIAARENEQLWHGSAGAAENAQEAVERLTSPVIRLLEECADVLAFIKNRNTASEGSAPAEAAVSRLRPCRSGSQPIRLIIVRIRSAERVMEMLFAKITSSIPFSFTSDTIDSLP